MHSMLYKKCVCTILNYLKIKKKKKEEKSFINYNECNLYEYELYLKLSTSARWQSK